MTEPPKEKPLQQILINAVGGIIAALVAAIAGIDAIKNTPSVSLACIVALAGIFIFYFFHYFGIIKTKTSENPALRKKFDDLRNRLNDGGTPAKLYASSLNWLLGKLDVFFGDGEQKEDKFAKFVGLDTDKPCWTAPAFDKCLLIALIYPIFTIFAVWLLFAHAGIVEDLLDFNDGETLRNRLIIGMLFISILSCLYIIINSEKKILILIAFLWVFSNSMFHILHSGNTTLFFLSFFATYVSMMKNLPFIFGINIFNINYFYGVLAITCSVALSVKSMKIGYFLGHVAIYITFFVALLLAKIKHGMLNGWLFLIIYIILIITIYITSYLVPTPRSDTLLHTKMMLVITFGLLPLINAPFDWFAIGVTRYLLQKGLKKGGWYPVWYALLDAFWAIVTVTLLAFTVVGAVQLFDYFAAQHAGESARVMRLEELLPKLKEHPENPEYWWIWLMLFSTFIPSIINLMIASTAFVRGVPWLNKFILSNLKNEDSVLLSTEYFGIALLLAFQVVVGVALAIGMLYSLASWILPWVLPYFADCLIQLYQ